MKAITFHRPGGPEVLSYEEIPAPVPGPGQVPHAAALVMVVGGGAAPSFAPTT